MHVGFFFPEYAFAGHQPVGFTAVRAAAQRLSLYLRCLGSADRGGSTVSSESLAASVGVSAAQVRRDLAALGHLGQRGIGYDAAALAEAIRRKLGINRAWRAALVGMGNLARALLRYRGFAEQGFELVAAFDNDPSKAGSLIEGLPIRPVADMKQAIAELGIELALVTVPQDAAQAVADELIAAGIRGLMNFAPVLLKVPSQVAVITVDLAIQLEQLAFAVQLRASE